jgi:tetratricopeptide (TPR) repeat protein
VKHAALLLLGALLLGGCAKAERADDCAPSDRVVDPVLLAFLSQARSAHHVADQQEAAGDTGAALRSLQGLVAGPKPPGAPPEVGEVIADTQARIADLLSRDGRFDQADSAIDAGLSSARAPSYFRGHLFEVRGLLEERREKALRSNGRGQEADQARERSLGAYEEAMKIQAQVIQEAAPIPGRP